MTSTRVIDEASAPAPKSDPRTTGPSDHTASSPQALPSLRHSPATIGDAVDDIDTPTLVLDLDAFETNLDRMQNWCDRHGVGLRAHAKAHKCPDISLQQIARGAIGICCQKVSEAIPFIEAGVRDILISNQIVGAPKLALLATLARHARVAVCVDHADNLRDIAQAMQAADSHVDILVEIDVGQGRCGVNTLDQALALARQAEQLPGVHFRGLQAYHGSVQHVREPAARAEICRDVAERIRLYRHHLESAGLTVITVSGAGTGSAQFDAASGAYTELQAGSYAFMDADYGANHWESDLYFETSLSLLTTVMSTATAGRVVLDAGLKAMTTESGLPRVMQRARLAVKQVNDEHTVLNILGESEGHSDDRQRRDVDSREVSADSQGLGAADQGCGDDSRGHSATRQASGADIPSLGDKVHLMLPHVDPAFNLHDVVVAVRAGKVQAIWPISARGPGR